jgi:lysyl-tRNA synthetase class II
MFYEQPKSEKGVHLPCLLWADSHLGLSLVYSLQNLKDWTDGGDIVGVKGTIRRTDKGELTVYV